MVKKAAKKTPKPIDEKYIYKQKDIYEKTGLPAKAIKRIRDSLPDNEWKMVVGKGYWYSECAKDMIQKRYDLDLSVKRDWLEAVSKGRNRHGLMCETLDKPTREVTVSVKDNTKFRMGQFVPIIWTGKDTARLNGRNPVKMQSW